MNKEVLRSLPSLKSLLILETLARNGDYMGINEIVQETEMSQATVHRILGEMVTAGYVEKNESYRKYRVGLAAEILASYFMQSNTVVTFARDEMSRLNQLTGETVHLMTLSGNHVIYLYKFDTIHPVGLMSYIGKTNPIHCTSGGKCILAYKPEEEITSYLQRSERQRFTENTLVTEEEIRKELALIKQRGYALDNGEHHSNVHCISSTIFDRNGNPVAAISISAPSYRFTIEQAQSLAEEIKNSCKIVTQRMQRGYI